MLSPIARTTATGPTGRRRWAGAVVGVLALATTAAGCGGGSGSDGGSSGTSDEPLTKENLVPSMMSAVKENPSAHIDMKISGAANVTASGDVDYSGDTTAMALTMQGMSSGGMQMRVVDRVIYLSAPPATPEGKFIKLDPSDPSNPMAGQLDDMLDQADPMASFRGWRTSITNLKYVGEEAKGGEKLDHYTVTVDSAKSMKSMGQQMPPGMPKTLTYQLFLDDEDLMREVTFDLGQVAMDITVDQWGEPVDIKAPSNADIVSPPTN